MLEALILLALIAAVAALHLVARRFRHDPIHWRYDRGRMRRKVNGQWQYRPATEQEQREHERQLADDFA